MDGEGINRGLDSKDHQEHRAPRTTIATTQMGLVRAKDCAFSSPKMSRAPVPHNPNLLLLVSFLIVQSVTASSSASNHLEQRQGTLPGSLPTTIDGNTGGTISSTGGTSDSGDVLASQPVTVQLGAGFIVGCVAGVILYGMIKVGSRIVERRMVPRGESRTRDRGREMEEAVLVEV